VVGKYAVFNNAGIQAKTAVITLGANTPFAKMSWALSP
jgi:hypothetical protein